MFDKTYSKVFIVNICFFIPLELYFLVHCTSYSRFSKWRPSAILDLVWRHSGPPATCAWWS